MKFRALLLLCVCLLQLTLLAEDKTEKKERQKQEKEEQKKLERTLEDVFGKPELADIPVPKDFVLLKESYVHQASSFRFGKIYLEGDMVIDDCEKFFSEQMVVAGWQKGEFLKNEKTVFKFTTYQLSFKKDRQLCVIQIGKNSTEGKTSLLIDLKPALE